MKNIEIIAGLDNKLQFPSGLCIDLENHCYITELHNASVHLFDLEKKTITKLSSDAMKNNSRQQIKKPLGITYNVHNGILITDTDENDIWHWNSRLQIWESIELLHEKEINNFNMLGGIACDSYNNIYINDFLNFRICKIDLEGIVTSFIPMNQELFDHSLNCYVTLTKPYGIYVHQNRLYFTDTGNNRIRYIELADHTLHTVDLEDIEDIKQPIALTFDIDGNLFICEQRKIIGISADFKDCLFSLDKEDWVREAAQFGISTKLKYAGAIVSPRYGELIVADTLKGLIYQLRWA